MSDIKLHVTDLATSIRLKELGVKQNSCHAYYEAYLGDKEVVAFDKFNQGEFDQIGIACAFLLSEVLELVDWQINDIIPPFDKRILWTICNEEYLIDFEGVTLLEAASKALIYQLENKK